MFTQTWSYAIPFHQYAVEPYAAPILRCRQRESVVVVARKGDEVVHWEDVEEGFNVSPIDEHGAILEHKCNQDRLGNALNCWIPGRGTQSGVGPGFPKL
jgi:hypothetical protein